MKNKSILFASALGGLALFIPFAARSAASAYQPKEASELVQTQIYARHNERDVCSRVGGYEIVRVEQTVICRLNVNGQLSLLAAEYGYGGTTLTAVIVSRVYGNIYAVLSQYTDYSADFQIRCAYRVVDGFVEGEDPRYECSQLTDATREAALYLINNFPPTPF